MKRIVALAVCFAAMTGACFAQTDFITAYDRQIRNVGYSGVGVETILEKWEAAEPDNVLMWEGKINFHFNKNKNNQLVVKDCQKFMGSKAVLTLKDSLGRPVRYFEETFFDEAEFAECQKIIDKAIEMFPLELMFREYKVSTLMEYEKENPELAFSEAMKLIAWNKSASPKWETYYQPSVDGAFETTVQNFCYVLYNVGSEKSFEYFRQISAAMQKQYPKNANFICNLGSYYLVARDDPRTAIKYYAKVLKLDPENQMALTNKKLAEKKMALQSAKH